MLRSCFSWAYRNRLLPTDPTSQLGKITLPQRDPRPLDQDEVAALLVAIPACHRRKRLLVTLLYETGPRVGEPLSARAAPSPSA